MKISVISVGKIKEKYLRDGIAEYSKRLGRYCTLEMIEVQDEKTPDGASQSVEAAILRKEGERILRYLREDAYVIPLAIDGKSMSSVALAKQIEELGIRGVSYLQFVIGGSLGLSPEVLKRADLKLSFSQMTFPHQLMRMILLEQIYRSFRIIHGEPYHK